MSIIGIGNISFSGNDGCILQVGSVPEYHLTAIQLVHKDTGAKYLHVDRNDPNNVFSVNFRTTPMDSTGKIF